MHQLITILLLYPDVDQMGDGWDALLLHHGGGAEHRAGRYEKDIAVHAALHTVQNMPAQHGRAAAAARAARVDVLVLAEYHHPAVLVDFCDIYAFFFQKVIKQP